MEIGKNKPIILVEVAKAAKKEKRNKYLTFFLSNILNAKYIEKTIKDKKIISLLLWKLSPYILGEKINNNVPKKAMKKLLNLFSNILKNTIALE